MRPGSANRPGARTVSVRSPGGDFGIFPRSPAQTTSGPSTTIAAFSSTRSPSKNPSTSNTVRIATQYRPAMPGALIERLRARGFVLPDYEGGGLLNVARTPQEHGNIAYFIWLEEFAQVTQMLRWGPGVNRRGSYFDDQRIDPRDYVKVGSVHGRIRRRGGASWVIEPEIFRAEAMTRMHAQEAEYAGYALPSSMSVRLRDLLERRPWGDTPAYVYAYWAGIDSVAHLSGPRSPEHATEAAPFDRALERALSGRESGDTLVMLTADHGHAATDPDRLIDLICDRELRDLLRNPIAGEPRLAFLHTDQPGRVKQHLERRYPNTFFLFDRDEAIDAGLFGRGDPEVARRRIGEVCAMLGDDRAASIVKVDGQIFRHRGSHGGMSPEEMNIPVLVWRA